jgi:Domain of unknown function (DUF4189)
MQRIISIGIAMVVAMLITTGASPARAEYGALARDDTTGKYGLSSGEETQSKADDVAIKECGSDGCKIVFRMGAGQCGAIATPESGKAWGAGRRPDKAAAELAAINNCQKQTKGQCKVRSSGCNR